MHISFLIFVLINIDHYPWSLKSIHDFLLQCGYISQTIISGSNTCITALKKHQRTVSKVSDSVSPLISMKEILLPPANEVCEGYVFTGVCLSTGEGGMRGCSREGVHGCLGGAWLLTGGCVVAPGACMVAPGGVHGCSGGHVWLLQRVCMVAPGGLAWLLPGGVHGCSGGVCGCSGGCAWDMTTYGDTVNEQAVRILLECILVLVLCKNLENV